MRPAVAVSAIGAVVSFLAVCADARPTDPEIARLYKEVIALNASLITYMSQAETSIGNDVELVHASILAKQLETVDTAAAYREAKSLIADLDALREHAIADLRLPSDYTPPNVPPPAFAGASTDPEPLLASTDQDLASFEHLSTTFGVRFSHALNRLLSISRTITNEEAFRHLEDVQMATIRSMEISVMTSSILSAANSSISSMVRNIRKLGDR